MWKKKYPRIEKLAFTLIVALRKLSPYFQAYTILVTTDQTLRKVMGRLDTTGRMVQWAIELSQFNVDYKLRTAIKAQALADFVVEFTVADQDPKSDYWMVYIDGSTALGIGKVGVIPLSPKKGVLKYGVQL